jgi:diadenosine tetraphosphate (Ap4A) HIT family hydrolase
MWTMQSVYSDEIIRIERHESEIPWLKVFTQARRKEFSDCTPIEKQAIWDALDVIERSMIEYYRPTKINIASFGNIAGINDGDIIFITLG